MTGLPLLQAVVLSAFSMHKLATTLRGRHCGPARSEICSYTLKLPEIGRNARCFGQKNKVKGNWARASIPKDRHPRPVQLLPIDVKFRRTCFCRGHQRIIGEMSIPQFQLFSFPACQPARGRQGPNPGELKNWRTEMLQDSQIWFRQSGQGRP